MKAQISVTTCYDEYLNKWRVLTIVTSDAAPKISLDVHLFEAEKEADAYADLMLVAIAGKATFEGVKVEGGNE